MISSQKLPVIVRTSVLLAEPSSVAASAKTILIWVVRVSKFDMSLRSSSVKLVLIIRIQYL
jgi:hypothetical protein